MKKEILIIGYKLSTEALLLVLIGSGIFFLGEMVLPGVFSRSINFSLIYGAIIFVSGLVITLGRVTDISSHAGKANDLFRQNKKTLSIVSAVVILSFAILFRNPISVVSLLVLITLFGAFFALLKLFLEGDGVISEE